MAADKFKIEDEISVSLGEASFVQADDEDEKLDDEAEIQLTIEEED